ncbi:MULTISPECIES: hypothetical protein [unclassified Achromobacter]|uniref:hypothetical protein n=1 Tax=unclassified Achromobacter TaxID=2626865 RepID=UPI000B516045|nr:MULTISPECIES: hypothetical protein [unclassified Achromobacter]OWT80895.1 hypothetical protein CEY05_05875 [Achromobacter sp. HZ34]OWT81411.1 hypothetical protein CEY04_05865 [Achromobacter sp. HZ28]
MKKTLATSLILSFALIGAAAQATPRGDTDNEPFQGTQQSDYRSDQASPQALNDVQQLPQDQISQTAMGDTDNAPFQGS